MWTQNLCLICIYILRNYAFQVSNEALFLAFLQPFANRLKSFIPPSRRLGKTSSASTFSIYCHPKIIQIMYMAIWGQHKMAMILLKYRRRHSSALLPLYIIFNLDHWNFEARSVFNDV